MKKFAKPGEGFVLVNDAPSGVTAVPGAKVSDKVKVVMARLLHLSREGAQLGGAAVRLAEIRVLVKKLMEEKGAFCLSPLAFTSKSEERISHPVAQEIVAASPLARSLARDLATAGLYGFIERQDSKVNKLNYRRYVDLLLASLCMSIHGASRTVDITPDAFLCWLRCFRTSDLLRWRDELWGAGRAAHFQCLREIVLAFARLSEAPQLTDYAGQGRLSANGTATWKSFCENAEGIDAEWIDFFSEWRASSRANRGDCRQMLRALARWSREALPGASVTEIMTARVREPNFADRLKVVAGSPLQYAGLARAAARFSVFVAEELRSLGVEAAIWPLVTQSEVDKATRGGKTKKAGTKHSEARSCPLPPQLQPIVEEILAEGKDGWPGRSGFFHEIVIDPGGQTRRLYCPVLPTFYRALLILPLRGGQMTRLDSGEGDLEMFDGHQRIWKPNTSPLAGFWKRAGDESGTPHGYAWREGGPTECVTGFHINTSKTGNPYIVPWEHPKLHRILWDLRLWQQEHHPISKPVAPKFYVDGDDKLDDERLDTMPEIFPLFRLPGTGRNKGISSPPARRKRDQAWQEIMAETERRWNERNPGNLIIIVKRQKKTGQPYGASYNVHGLRVAGLTRLFMSGVPIEILSKLVAGHRGLIMTMYYLKFKPAHVHRMLEEAAVRSDAIAAQGFMDDIKSWTLEQAKARSAFLQDDGLAAAVEMDGALKLMFTNVTIGMCPWAGTRCSDGGALDRSYKRPNGNIQAYYRPVEGGEKNCIMCRHLISGPPWMKELWLYGTQLLQRFTHTGDRIDDLERRREILLSRRNAAATEEERTVLQREEAALAVQRDVLVSVQVLTLTSIHRVERLLEMSEEIRLRNTKDATAGGVDLIVQDPASATEFIEATDFERSAVLTASSRVYPMMHDAQTEARRNAFLDRVIWENGGVPLTIAPLTDDQKLFAQDSLSRLLMERLEREETRAVIEGRLRLQDVGLVEEVERIVRHDLGKPLPLMSIEHAGSDLLAATK